MLLIFVIFIALIIKINYFFIIITGLLIFFFLALDMNNKKLKFDLEIYFFEVITTFYLSREKGMGFNLLEDYYDDIDKLKLLVIFFIIFGIFYILIKKKNYLLKLYFIAILPYFYYSCFRVLCQFLLYSIVTHSYIYLYLYMYIHTYMHMYIYLCILFLILSSIIIFKKNLINLYNTINFKHNFVVTI